MASEMDKKKGVRPFTSSIGHYTQAANHMEDTERAKLFDRVASTGDQP